MDDPIFPTSTDLQPAVREIDREAIATFETELSDGENWDNTHRKDRWPVALDEIAEDPAEPLARLNQFSVPGGAALGPVSARRPASPFTHPADSARSASAAAWANSEIDGAMGSCSNGEARS